MEPGIETASRGFRSKRDSAVFSRRRSFSEGRTNWFEDGRRGLVSPCETRPDVLRIDRGDGQDLLARFGKKFRVPKCGFEGCAQRGGPILRNAGTQHIGVTQ